VELAVLIIGGIEKDTLGLVARGARHCGLFVANVNILHYWTRFSIAELIFAQTAEVDLMIIHRGLFFTATTACLLVRHQYLRGL
jgi:hypothetical protein